MQTLRRTKMKDVETKLIPTAVGRKLARIARTYDRRTHSAGAGFHVPSKTPGARLRKEVYRLVRSPRNKESLEAEFRVDWGGGAFRQETWERVLTAIFARLGPITKAYRNRIRLMAHELQYADKNNVPSKYLIGFIYQAGGSKGVERIRAAERLSTSPADGAGLSKATSAAARSMVTREHSLMKAKRGPSWGRRPKASLRETVRTMRGTSRHSRG